MQRSPTEAYDNEARSSPVIQVSNLVKTFVKGGRGAVNDISFEVGHEVVTLFGPSGCGKTTTLRCIAGLETPDSGEIYIDGKPVTSIEKGLFVPPEKRNVGLVFQSYALWPHMKVFDNVAYGLRVKHVPKDELTNRVRRALEIVDLTGYEGRYPAQLSGGQQQRVALARSIVYEPKVLLMDEPLSNLDAKIRERTRLELRNLLEKVGIASIYVTHDQEEAFQISDRIVVMSAGKIMQVGTPHQIYHSPTNEFVASFVGRSNLIEGVVTSVNGKDGSSATGTVRIFGSYELECQFPASLKEKEKCLVMVRSNEIGIYRTQPQEGDWIKAKTVSRMYKGAMTDYVVLVGGVSLVVSTHRFCDLTDIDSVPEGGRDDFLVIRGDSVSVVPLS